MPSCQRYRAGLHDEVVVVAGRLEADLGLCWAYDQPDPALARRTVGKLKADHYPMIGKVSAREVACAPGPQQKPRIRVLITQLDPAFASGAERQEDGPKLIAGIGEDVADSRAAVLSRGRDNPSLDTVAQPLRQHGV